MAEQGEILEERPLLSGQKKFKAGSGFWLRAGAFIADIFLLGFFMYFLTFIAKEHLLSIGKGSIYFAFFIIFLYFFLLNGSLGKGKTPGKILFNIVTTNADLNYIPFSSSFKRTLIQLNAFIAVIFIFQPFLKDAQTLGQQFFNSLLPLILLAFNVGNMVFLATHPFRQGIHDLAAKSFVHSEAKKMTEAEMAEKVGESSIYMLKNAFQVGATVIIVILIVGGFLTYKNTYSKDAKLLMKERVNFQQMCKVEGFELDVHPETRKTGQSQEQQKETNPLKKIFSSPNQQSVEQDSSKVVLVFTYYAFKFYPSEFFTSRDIKEKITSITEWIKNKLNEDLEKQVEVLNDKKDYAALKRIKKLIGTEEIEFKFVQRLDLILYNYNQSLHEESFPIGLKIPETLIALEKQGLLASDDSDTTSQVQKEK